MSKCRFWGAYALIIMLCAPVAHGDEIWSQGSDLFIRLESQDTLRGALAPANSHPAKISAESVRNALSLIYYAPESDDEATPLFAERTLDILSVAIAKGLSEARRNQDVTFLIETWHELFLGLSEAMVVGGRAFMTDDSLNLIIGSLRAPNRRTYSEGEHKALNKDSRLHPYFIGYRDKRIKKTGFLSAEANSGVYAASANRRDWLVFTPLALGTGDDTPPASMQKQMQTTQTPPPAPARQQTTQSLIPSSLDGNAAQESPEDAAKRLDAIKKLYEDGLITEQDYNAKKREILNKL